jgi:hypothetical protein
MDHGASNVLVDFFRGLVIGCHFDFLQALQNKMDLQIPMHFQNVVADMALVG